MYDSLSCLSYLWDLEKQRWATFWSHLEGGNASHKLGGTILTGKVGGVLTICNTAVFKLCYWIYCKRSYRIPPFPKFLLFHLFCIYWDWKGQECKLECPKVNEINYIVAVIYACTHPCGIYKHHYPQSHKNTFIATENS